MNNPLPRILALLPTEEAVLINDALIDDIRKILVDTNSKDQWLESTIKELLVYLHQKSVIELTNVTENTFSIRNIYKGNKCQVNQLAALQKPVVISTKIASAWKPIARLNFYVR